jgi:alpha-L-fucosidase
MHAQEIIDMIHQIQPNCLVNNRLGPPGDYGTPEQKIPDAKSDTPFEVCMTLNKHWGYNKADHDFKQPKEVIQKLADIASKGGNFLLNVGPTAEGVIPDESTSILSEVGKWMKANGESIYGTSASPLDAAPRWGRITAKGDGRTYYLHVFEWPSEGRLTIPELPGGTPKKARLLAAPDRKVDVIEGSGGDANAIDVGADVPDANDSVIAVEVE